MLKNARGEGGGNRMQKKIGVAGIIPRGRTVLVLRRSHTDGFLPGAYDLPGADWSPASLLARESGERYWRKRAYALQ